MSGFCYQRRSRAQWAAAAGLDDPDLIGVAGAAWLQGILDAAAICDLITDWEEQFLSDLNERFERFGPRLYLSDRQRAVLSKLERRLQRHEFL
jgi:hypothetical protein